MYVIKASMVIVSNGSSLSVKLEFNFVIHYL
jgi:hypothetical protein